jgi:hypothetical protein
LVCLVKPNLKGHDLNGALFQTPAVYVDHCADEYLKEYSKTNSKFKQGINEFENLIVQEITKK